MTYNWLVKSLSNLVKYSGRYPLSRKQGVGTIVNCNRLKSKKE